MTKPVAQIEQEASRLRRYLRASERPDLQLLCILKFFESWDDMQRPGLESYAHEFVPLLVDTAAKTSIRELLPDEIQSLQHLVDALTGIDLGDLLAADLAMLRQFLGGEAKMSETEGNEIRSRAGGVAINCLFVEYYPDLNLLPRGRLLQLTATASPISSRFDADDVVVRNPLSKPDDRFFAQARDSVSAARAILSSRYGISAERRYRLDFTVGAEGARLTGDSLGAALALATVAAVTETELLRSRPVVSHKAAFSGALDKDGSLTAVDGKSLTLKISRAFHSDLECLVIPQVHLESAGKHLKLLQSKYPKQSLKLIGANSLESIIDDSRVVQVVRDPWSTYIGRRTAKTARTTGAQVGLLLLIVFAVLCYLFAPAKYMPWFDDNPALAVASISRNCLEVFNRDSVLLWADTLNCRLSTASIALPNSPWRGQVFDCDGDGRNEVVWLPRIDEDCSDRSWIRFYTWDGTLRFKRFAPIIGKTPFDTDGVLYDATALYLTKVGSKPVLISTVTQELPARMHIRFWDGAGDSLGWYVHAGHGDFLRAVDLDNDGIEELLFACFNNGMRCAALLALDAKGSEGISPFRQQEGRNYDWVLPGNQYGYVLFPVSDLGRVPEELPTEYNSIGPSGVEISDKGQLKVFVCESYKYNRATQIIYFLDSSMRVENVDFTDSYKKRRSELVAQGRLAPITNLDEYMASLRDSVIYWNDSGFVSEAQLRSNKSHN